MTNALTRILKPCTNVSPISLSGVKGIAESPHLEGYMDNERVVSTGLDLSLPKLLFFVVLSFQPNCIATRFPSELSRKPVQHLNSQ